MAVARARVGRGRISRCGARLRRLVVLLAMPAALLLLRRWPLPLRLTAACAVLPLCSRPRGCPKPAHGTCERARRRPWHGGADRDAFARVAVRHRRQLEHAGRAAARSWCCRRSMPYRRRASTCWCCRRSTPIARRAPRRWPSNARCERIWSAAAGPPPRCRSKPAGIRSFAWDDVEFGPSRAGGGGKYCVLRVAVGAHAILLAGDLDAAAERALRGALAPARLRAMWYSWAGRRVRSDPRPSG